jgi:hypothetical protein
MSTVTLNSSSMIMITYYVPQGSRTFVDFFYDVISNFRFHFK